MVKINIQSAEYQAIYPQGVSQYRIANKASLPVLTERFIGSVREHGGEPGRQIAEEAQALLSTIKEDLTDK